MLWGELCDQDGEARIVDGQIMIVSNAAPNAVPGMYREPFDGIQLRKLPEPPPLMPSEVPGTYFGLFYLLFIERMYNLRERRHFCDFLSV